MYLNDYLLTEKHCEAFLNRVRDRLLCEIQDDELFLKPSYKFRIVSNNPENQILIPIVSIVHCYRLKLHLKNNVLSAETSFGNPKIDSQWLKLRPWSIIKLAQRNGYKDVSAMIDACFGSNRIKTEWNGQVIDFDCSQMYSRKPKYINALPEKYNDRTQWFNIIGSTLIEHGLTITL